jgi:hypothetical protein
MVVGCRARQKYMKSGEEIKEGALLFSCSGGTFVGGKSASGEYPEMEVSSMVRSFAVACACALVIAGCATGPQVTLDQIQPHHVVAGDKSSLMNAVRMFAMREQYKISSFEEETGRVVAFRNVSLSRQDESRRIIMHLSIVPGSGNSCELDARFAFGDSPGTLTKEEENILVGCYTALYDHLGISP